MEKTSRVPPGKSQRANRKEEKKRLQFLNKKISLHGQRKQLSKALRFFQTIQDEGLKPTDYSYTSIINAYVRNGDVGCLRFRRWVTNVRADSGSSENV